MPTLGERIKHLREIKGLSQKELSLQTNLTVVQLSRYETNHRKPDPDALGRLVNFWEQPLIILLDLPKNLIPMSSPQIWMNIFCFICNTPYMEPSSENIFMPRISSRMKPGSFLNLLASNHEQLNLIIPNKKMTLEKSQPMGSTLGEIRHYEETYYDFGTNRIT